jgi:DMSO/TMAO reductase YedYZ molybdopterin-dependent catalytic subunit
MRTSDIRRRDFLKRSAPSGMFVTGLYSGGNLLFGQSPASGLIVREHEPENLEFPFSSLDSYLTPNERFYIRSHFPIPKLDPGSYRLRIDGAVEKPFDISLDELRQLSPNTITATLECAGNSRVFLVPQASGAQWELGAVSNAEWTGVPLSVLLRRAGMMTAAVDVVLEGADRGEPKTEPKPPGGTPYIRSISVAKARQPEVLIAYSMNGKDLPASHGSPVRAVVPGYYGMSSVKWLTRIQIVTEPYHGYWQTTDYAYWDRSTGSPVRRALMDMMVKSLIARPMRREVVKGGSVYRVFGAAWTGDANVSKVEVSADGGKSWLPARLIDKELQFAWRRWELDWQAPQQKGKVTILSRATDSRGNTQPAQHNRDTGSYVIHHTLPIEVEID